MAPAAGCRCPPTPSSATPAGPPPRTSQPRAGRRLVVCAWALHDLPPPEAARRTYGTLLALAQAAAAAGSQAGPTDAVIATCGAHDVLGTESGHPWLTAVTGLARVVNQ